MSKNYMVRDSSLRCGDAKVTKDVTCEKRRMPRFFLGKKNLEIFGDFSVDPNLFII